MGILIKGNGYLKKGAETKGLAQKLACRKPSRSLSYYERIRIVQSQRRLFPEHTLSPRVRRQGSTEKQNLFLLCEKHYLKYKKSHRPGENICHRHI